MTRIDVLKGNIRLAGEDMKKEKRLNITNHVEM